MSKKGRVDIARIELGTVKPVGTQAAPADDVSLNTIGLHQFNGGVMTSHATDVTGHMRDGAEFNVFGRNTISYKSSTI